MYVPNLFYNTNKTNSARAIENMVPNSNILSTHMNYEPEIMNYGTMTNKC